MALYVKAMLFLISAIASAGFSPLGHVLEQLRMVWHRYKLMLLLRASWRSAIFSSRESAIQRYDWSRTAGPRYSSWFHQYDGHEVEQQAQRMHS
jgi:ADP-heptose:LPS heptosyltransferase